MYEYINHVKQNVRTLSGLLKFTSDLDGRESYDHHLTHTRVETIMKMIREDLIIYQEAEKNMNKIMHMMDEKEELPKGVFNYKHAQISDYTYTHIRLKDIENKLEEDWEFKANYNNSVYMNSIVNIYMQILKRNKWFYEGREELIACVARIKKTTEEGVITFKGILEELEEDDSKLSRLVDKLPYDEKGRSIEDRYKYEFSDYSYNSRRNLEMLINEFKRLDGHVDGFLIELKKQTGGE